MSHRYFKRLQEQLSQVGTVHAIDLPGYGANRRPRENLSVEANAAVLGSALDALDVSSCVVIGHSMGAQFVVELAIQRPDLVSHVVVIGPVAEPDRRSALMQGARLGLDTFVEPLVVNAIVFSDYVRCGIPWYVKQLRPMLTYRIEDRVQLVACPVLVLRGGKDPIAPQAWCEDLAARALDGSAASIPGGAHVIQFSRAKQVAETVLAFAAQRTDASR